MVLVTRDGSTLLAKHTMDYIIEQGKKTNRLMIKVGRYTDESKTKKGVTKSGTTIKATENTHIYEVESYIYDYHLNLSYVHQYCHKIIFNGRQIDIPLDKDYKVETISLMIGNDIWYEYSDNTYFDKEGAFHFNGVIDFDIRFSNREEACDISEDYYKDDQAENSK